MLRGRGGRSPVQSVSYSFVCVKWGKHSRDNYSQSHQIEKLGEEEKTEMQLTCIVICTIVTRTTVIILKF